MSRAFYAEQSHVTRPGAMAEWLADLPADVPALRRVARNLVIHYRGDDPIGQGIPPERLAEIDTRYAEPMLQRLAALKDGSLAAERAPAERLVGCCRDFTVLFLTLLRQQGIPARGRVGFASYFIPGWNVDHEVAEVWDGADRRWRLIDAELADVHVDAADGAALDARDLPRDRFILAGDAWAVCRAGEADPARFVVDPGLEIEETRGWPQLRHNLIQDLAALNKHEMLLWDTWGILTGGPSAEAELALLDRIAALTRSSDPPLAEVQALYADEPGLRVPGVVTSFDPLSGTPRQVKLATGC